MPITIFLLMLQVGWFFVAVLRLTRTAGVISNVIEWLALLLAIYIVSRRDNPAYKLAWILLVLGLPVFGMLLYLLFGHSSVNKYIKRTFEQNDRQLYHFLKQDGAILEEIKTEDKQLSSIARYIKDVAKYPVYRNEYLRYHSDADIALNELIEQLKKAEKFIFMEYFILEPSGKIGKQILDILEEKTKAGVDVRLLFDDIGSLPYIDKSDINDLKKRGINYRRFNPIIPVLAVFMNNRDHRKITVIDGETGFLGGYNLADEYANIKQPYGHWKDNGIVVKGQCVENLTAMFLGVWNAIGKQDVNYEAFFNKTFKAVKSDGYIQPYADTPLDKEQVGKDVYMNIIKTASDYVYMYTPYLIIDNELMSQLCLAAKSGVDVRIVVPGIPDKKLVYMTTRSYYSQLTEAGVRIYEYKPGFLHAKTFVSDDTVASVGSINMDFRSLYLHFESGAILYYTDAIKDIKNDFENVFDKSIEITCEMCKNQGILIKAMQTILRLFAPLM